MTNGQAMRENRAGVEKRNTIETGSYQYRINTVSSTYHLDTTLGALNIHIECTFHSR